MPVAPASITVDPSTPAFAAAGRIVRRWDRDAYLASYFLPRSKRQALWAVLAFCRMIREAIGSREATLENARGMREHPAVVSPQHVAAISAGAANACGCGSEIDERVAMFRDRLAEIYDGRVELPAVASRSDQQHAIEAVGRVVREYQIPKELFLELVDGLRLDQSIRRYATWSSLEKHLHRVSGVVGVIVSGVLGVTHSDAASPAAALGKAIRLIGILRGLHEDLPAGTLYLPLEDLVRCRVTEKDVLAGRGPAALAELVKLEVARARELLRTAAEGICWLADDGSRLAVSAVVLRAAAQLDEIRRWDDGVGEAPMLSTPRKLRLLPAVWRLARRQSGEPLPDGL